MKNYYEILEVKPTATINEIKKSYRKLAKKYHPDENKGDKKIAEKFSKISEAYSILCDEEKRSKYDNKLKDTTFNQNPFENKNTTQHNKVKKDFTMNESGFNSMNERFESFFGFDPKTKKMNKNKKKNNTDAMKTEDAFKHIFGSKF